MMRNKFVTYSKLVLQPQCEHAYAFDCTIIRLICLTAKALRRMTMRGFLVGTTEPDNHTLKRVNAMDGVYAAFAWSKKAVQLRFLGL